jgi:hypothetical protein
MNPRVGLALASVLALLAVGGPAFAVSAVFDGDPRDPATQIPYEVLPGHPLVRPGPDGILGTADDVLDPSVIGDIDIVVRAGVLGADAVIPRPAAAGGRAALPVGVAGPTSAGGTEVPFTVLLSTGHVTDAEPAGRLLTAPDMDGIPVIVAAFADLDGDGVIGPTVHDSARSTDIAAELRELEPVGRAAAVFAGGIAHGSIAVSRGLPASRGGLIVALVAMALTGPLDPSFFAGVIPSGPAISTALPFLPLRDLTRLVRDRPAAFGPGTTLQDVLQPAAIPDPDSYAIPLDGSTPTIDAAVVLSQPAVRVGFRGATGEADRALDHLILGTTPPMDRVSMRLLPVDRFDNPADPPPDWNVTLSADAGLRISGQRRRPHPIPIRSAQGVRVLAVVAPGGAGGALRVERAGVAIAALPFVVDERINRPLADVTVPSASIASIQAGIDTATDRNGDGVVAVRIRRGVFRERLTVRRTITLAGAGGGATVLVGDGTSATVTIAAPGVVVRDLTVAGGAPGIAADGNGTRLISADVSQNTGPGVELAAANNEVWNSRVEHNGAGGIAVGGAAGVRCSDTLLRDNQGAGLSAQSAAGVEIAATRAVENGGAGFSIVAGSGATLGENQSVLNIGPGIELIESSGAMLEGNLCAANDDDGLHMDRAGGAVVIRNSFDSNKGYGLFVRRTADADFAATAGTQGPPGDNTAVDNRKGDVFVRTN